MHDILMVDLKSQYKEIKAEIDQAVMETIAGGWYVGGQKVDLFEKKLAAYCGCKHAVSCANGTDALQIALMSLGIKAGDEVIVPSFTYISTAEVVTLLGATPVFVDVDIGNF